MAVATLLGVDSGILRCHRVTSRNVMREGLRLNAGMTTRALAHITTLAAAFALAACGTATKAPAPPAAAPAASPAPPAPPRPAATAPAPAPASPPAPAAPVPPPPAVWPQLVAEQRWLEDLFRGTPVVVEPAGPGPNAPLKLEVPLRFAFDDGQAAVKPPLGAVLDKVATSLQRQPRARVGVAASAPDRVASITRHLAARGVAAHRIERLPLRSDAVELRLRIVDVAAISRLPDPPKAQP